MIADSAIAGALNSGAGPARTFIVNWDSPPTLEGNYQTSMTYDALGRIKTMRYPRDVDGNRKALTPMYNRAGALENVKLDGDTYVERIAYNAKGQRTLIAYGNNVMMRYAYDAHTFRLVRLRTEHYAKQPGLDTFELDGGLLQDFAHEYDLAGNILKIHDCTPGSGLLGTDALDREFGYDPLYRLLSATGRECDVTPPPPPAPQPRPWDDIFKCDDVTRTRPYTQIYEYDAAGNMLHMHHESTPGAFNRDFAFVPNTNRLQTVTDTEVPRAYQYDANGNMIRENTDRHFAWDFADRLIGFANRATLVSPASLEACYLYDAAGQRVKKYARNQQGQVEATVYIDGVFEHHVKNGAANNTLHVMDNQSRIALVRVGNAFPDDGAPNMKVKYHLGDHLGSSSVVVGGADARANGLINREEYFPYGETSFGSFARKRYRFTGKERDEESGLYYHGARYYAPWLARWVSCDPAGMVDGINWYAYAQSNPLCFVDSNGTNAMPNDASSVPKSESLPLLPTLDLTTRLTPEEQRRLGGSSISASSGPLDPRDEIQKFNMSDDPLIQSHRNFLFPAGRSG